MDSKHPEPDPAAVFASALSLWLACKRQASKQPSLNLSEAYNGMDEFMRVVVRIGTLFEEWSCRHLAFDYLDEVWPYLLEDRFGDVCLELLFPTGLNEFDETDCLRVALVLRLPIRPDDKLPLPVVLSAANPTVGSGFCAMRIQTVRNFAEDDFTEPFTPDEDPFDDNYDPPYFGLYGIDAEGLLEHIADRSTYSAAVALARKLMPGITFPDAPPPTFSRETAGEL